MAAEDPDHPNPYMFTGRQFDIETGLYYYRARYYNPHIGRFMQTDPVGYEAGMNLYLYCKNNPLILVDPFGTMFATYDNGADPCIPYDPCYPNPTTGPNNPETSLDDYGADEMSKCLELKKEADRGILSRFLECTEKIGATSYDWAVIGGCIGAAAATSFFAPWLTQSIFWGCMGGAGVIMLNEAIACGKVAYNENRAAKQKYDRLCKHLGIDDEKIPIK